MFPIGITPGGRPGIEGTPDAPPPGIPVDIEPPERPGVPLPTAEGAGPALASAAASGLTLGPYPDISIMLSLLVVYQPRIPAQRRDSPQNMAVYLDDQAQDCADQILWQLLG